MYRLQRVIGLSKQIIGIDIGGTKVKIGLLDIRGNIQSKWDIHTNTNNNGAFIVDEIWESILSKSVIEDDQEILGIGIGAPGFVDAKTGTVHEAVNIGWENFELGKRFEKKTNLPVFVENDANLAALGENWKGAGGLVDDLIVITLGTGVGSGIVSNGEVLQGVSGTAGEIGHIIVDPNGNLCNCGRIGCLDTIASANGIVRNAKNVITKDPTSELAKFYHKNNEITSKDIFVLASQANEDCIQIIDWVADALGTALANAATILNPSKILIGGGLSKAGDLFLNKIKKSFLEYSLDRIGEATQIGFAELENDAGITGAAFLVYKELQKNENCSQVVND